MQIKRSAKIGIELQGKKNGKTKNWITNSWIVNSITVPFVRPRVIVRHVLAAELREPPLDI